MPLRPTTLHRRPVVPVDSGSVLIDGRPIRGPLSGVGQYVWHLTDSLVSRSTDLAIELMAFDHALFSNDSLRRRPLPSDVLQRRFSVLPRKAFNAVAAYAPAVPARLFGLDPDLFHSTYFERMPTLRRTTRLVSTIHDVAFLRHPEAFSRINLAASRRALRWQLDASDAILTPSSFTRDELVALCGVEAGRITVTPLAITETSSGNTRDDPQESAGRGRPFALYLGNLDPRKNLVRLLEAWQVSGLGKSHDLVLAGQLAGHDRRLRDRLDELGDPSVVPLGFVPAATKRRLLSRCDCFVYPSLYEGFGIPVLEAMAAGAPVVTSTAGALLELTDGAALAVAPTDVGALSEALCLVLGDAAVRDDLSARGRRRAVDFSWDRTAELTTSVYRSVLA